MNSWQLAVVALALLAVAGCRTDPNIALLERELRLQEDEIYRLRDCIKDYQAALQSRPEDTAVSERSGTVDSGWNGLPRSYLPEGVPPVGEQSRPSRDDAVPGDRGGVAPPYQPPREGQQPERPGQGKPWQGQGDSQLPMTKPSDEDGAGPGRTPRPSDGPRPVRSAAGKQATQLVLHPRLTGGYDADGRPGHEGITVVIEPRDAQGRSVLAPADVSVIVLDPALEGGAARVARWDFTAAETAAHLQNAGGDRAIRLELPWPADPPVHGQLYLSVRYTTGEGRKLQAEGPIRIIPPEQPSGGWGPAEPAPPIPEGSRPGLAARTPAPPSPSPEKAPTEPKVKRPVWSPDRP